jgi:hypothetical protein
VCTYTVGAHHLSGQRRRVDAFFAAELFAGVFFAGVFFTAVFAPRVRGSPSGDRPVHSAWTLSSIAD